LFSKKLATKQIVLNFTERYRNHSINYFFLKKYQDNLIFAGTKKEHESFCINWELEMPRLEIKNFLDLAYVIRDCKFFLGCQSFCWNLAEAMKTPRILEICQYAPNCQPFIGEDSYGFLHQVGVEYYVEKLMNK